MRRAEGHSANVASLEAIRVRSTQIDETVWAKVTAAKARGVRLSINGARLAAANHADAVAYAATMAGHVEAARASGTSPLNHEKRAGEFFCAGCGAPLFEFETKYDSGSGWPSFYAPKEGAVETTTDTSLGMQRTEVHCAQCQGHLG